MLNSDYLKLGIGELTMNREILFRGFHECENGSTDIIVGGKEKRGVWLHGYYCAKGYGEADFDCIEPRTEDGSDCYGSWGVIPSTVGQFTGLTDKNGKRVFEGDIVSDGVIDYIVEFCGSAWVKRVGWTSGGHSKLHYNANKLTVTSNIFSNSNLIGGESNV